MAIDTRKFIQAPDNPQASMPNPDFGKEIISSATLQSVGSVVDVPELQVSETPPVVPPPPPVTPTAPTAPVTPQKDPFGELKDFLGDIKPPVSQAAEFKKAQESSDIVAKQQRFNQASAQLSAIQAQGRQAQLDLESRTSGKNITTQFLGRQQAEISRQVAIKSLPLTMELDLARGDLTSAQNNLNTLFNLRVEDAKNLNDFNNKLTELVFNVASKEQQNILDRQIRKENRDFQVLQANQNYARNVANSIIQSEPLIASQIAQIDWTKEDAQQQFASLTSQISVDPMLVLDRRIKEAQLNKIQRETAQIGQPSKAELKAIDEATKQAQASIPVARAKVKSVEELLIHKGLNTSVGSNILTRRAKGIGGFLKGLLLPGLGAIDVGDTATGQAQNFAGQIHRLVSGLSLDSLIDAKARGATFGALSDRELTVLSNAATAINDWEMKDKDGNGIGIWNIDEKSFRIELNRIKDLTNEALLRSEGTLIDSEEESLLDNIYNNQDASVYY